MSNLPADFHFSQGSLQDYVDCPRRFQLRYMMKLAWPAVEAEPAVEYANGGCLSPAHPPAPVGFA